MISEADATQRLQSALSRVDSRLELDRGAIRYLTDPYPGVEFGLRLGEAGALLFMSEADLTAADWEMRLFKRLEAAKRYLEEFPQVGPDARYR
ncbi:MAG: hypothetical protein HYY39_02735 [Armatimonadetes bacterium]|nr:hypothetical protein [Armatimonadota bacterium]